MLKQTGLLALLIAAAPAFAQDELLSPIEPPVATAPDAAAQARAALLRGDAAEALSRYLRIVASRPDDASALAGAGRAAIGVGDLNAAAGFLARAEARDPRNGEVKAGLAETFLQRGDYRSALRYFRDAVGLGVPVVSIAANRGLAYDLRGDQRRAQADYAAALAAHPDAEVVRRLALSQAISGDRAAALATLDPLLRRQDVPAWRARAFVYALTGDASDALTDAALVMPRDQVDALGPYLPRLAALRPGEKAAAIHLGRFPGENAPPSRTAAATPPAVPAKASPPPVQVATATTPSGATRPPVVTPPAVIASPQRASALPTPAPVATAAAIPRTPVSQGAASQPALPALPAEVAIAAPPPVQIALATPPAAPGPATNDPALPIRTPVAPPQPMAEAAQASVPSISAPGVSPETQGVTLPAVPTAPATSVSPDEDTKARDRALAAVLAEARSRAAARPPSAPAQAEAAKPTAAERLAQQRSDEKARRADTAAKKKAADEAKAKAEAAKAEAEAKLAKRREPARHWVQVAGGANKNDLDRAWDGLKAKWPKQLAGRSPWTTHYRFTNRLLIGPFPSSDAAQDWVSDRKKEGLATFRVETSAGDPVERVKD